jgi:hypothetical protein
MATLTVTLVEGNNGIDQDASLNAFRSALATFVVEREIQEDTIANAVHSLFDKYLGVNINMPALCSSVLQALNVQPENFKVMETRVQEYVRQNSDLSEKKDKEGNVVQIGEPVGTRAFHIAKGKGGGVTRTCDRPINE